MKIYRNNDTVRSDGGQSRRIHGTALVFDSWSHDLGGFREIIRRGALNEDILAQSDIMANMDHSTEYVMARSKFGSGNLRLTLTDDGLEFEFDAPETAKGEELLQHVKRGEYTTCSFCFSLPSDGSGEHWFNDGVETRREIIRFDRIWDVSVVYSEAYADTSVDVRQSRAMDEKKAKLYRMEAEIKAIYVGESDK